LVEDSKKAPRKEEQKMTKKRLRKYYPSICPLISYAQVMALFGGTNRSRLLKDT